MTTILIPCPFCEEGANLHICADGDGYFVVECGSCAACGPFGVTEERAAAFWNGRTEADQMVLGHEQEVDNLMDKLEAISPFVDDEPTEINNRQGDQ